jgi:hypothetical protein
MGIGKTVRKEIAPVLKALKNHGKADSNHHLQTRN